MNLNVLAVLMTLSSEQDGFATAVSMEDGVVVHLCPNITKVLGYPKDMWIGRSFIDFVHPKDRIAFASHITCGLSFPIGDDHSGTPGKSRPVNSEPFFCRMREYRGLKSTGFGVVDKPVVYFPFKLTMKLKEIDLSSCSDPATTHENKENGYRGPGSPHAIPVVHLVILATRINSSFQTPEEVPTNPVKFITRHSATCNFGHFDTEGISYLGHLPQDLIGNSILDYYHPEDMGLLKGIYEGVMLQQGKPFRSKPYRFRAFNGTFALIETDWSCFINPWSWKLEFVIGQHRVIKGPMNPNVFMQPREEDILKVSEGLLKECKVIQEEIKLLLNETVSRRLSDPMRQQSTRRKKDLATLMESLLEPTPVAENSIKSGSQSQCSGTFSLLEKGTVMLGEISPYRDDQSGSNESSETPPSYSQLNFRENIERFFQSHPKTTRSPESTERMEMARSSTDEESKVSPCPDYSSGSNNGHWSNGSNGSGDFGNADASLTENLLLRHNDKMEKIMTRRRDTQRRQKPKSKNIKIVPAQHAPKRATNSSWCGDSGKAIKLPHLESAQAGHESPHPSSCTCPNFIPLWPPFPISYTSAIPGLTTIPFFTTKAPILSPLEASNSVHQIIHSKFPSNSQPNFRHPEYTLSPALFNQPMHSIYSGPRVPVHPELALEDQPTTSQRSSVRMLYSTQEFSRQQEAHAHELPRCHQAQNFSKEMGSLFQHSEETGDRAEMKAAMTRRDDGKSAMGYGKTDQMKMKPKKEQRMELESSSETSKDLTDSCSSSMYSLLKTDESRSISVHTENDVSKQKFRDELDEHGVVQNQSWIEMLDESKYFMIHLDETELSSEIIFRFQLPVENSAETLSKNFDALKLFGQQYVGVSEQLDQLYAAFKRENKWPHALLEDEGTTSSGNESTTSENLKPKSAKRWGKFDYGVVSATYEETEVLPPAVKV